VRYGAFLSYSHADERHARLLLQRLEGYRIPKRLIGTAGRHGPVPARLGPVFRDRDELHAAGDLGSTITAALADSAALVVVCSPAAARSRWVNAEADAFRASGRGDRIFCFVVDGDPTGRDPAQVCFPPALQAAWIWRQQAEHRHEPGDLAKIGIVATGGVLVLLFSRPLGRALEGHARQPLRPSAQTLEVER